MVSAKKKILTDKSISKQLEEKQEDRFALQRMSEKIREITGEGYVFILFDAKYPPKIGDEITLGNLTAVFRKRKC